jgi:serine/threonine-protein phosphatase 5
MALLEEATRHKDLGNALLGQHRYTQAVEQYTKAISLCPTAIFLSNRAQAYIKLESYGLAIQDADEATRLDPSYVKAYYRRGSAHFALGKLKDAKKDFKGVLALVPADAEANKKLKACEKAIREEAFLKAIESDVAAVAPYSDVDPASIPLESDYDGPHLTDCGPEGSGTELVTLEFVRAMVERFRATKLVAKRYVVQMLLAARTLFRSLPSLIRVQLPVDAEGKVGHFTVCGDTHGQFYDLCHIFEKGGFPSESNPFLFNGDYVDRGSFSFEVVMTLIALKLACPSALHLLRGNHETKNMNKIYGFEGEVRAKYDDRVMGLFAEVFSWLPLAAVLQDSVFVVHGGLSTQDEGRISLAQIESTPRGREPPESGLMSDLVRMRALAACLLALNTAALTDTCVALERPPARGGSVPQQARGGLLVRAGLHAEVPRHERTQPDGALARGEGRGLRCGARRHVHNDLLGAQLLRPDGQQGCLRPLQSRPQAAVHAVRGSLAP